MNEFCKLISGLPVDWQFRNVLHDARQYSPVDWHPLHSVISEHLYLLPSRFPVSQLDVLLVRLCQEQEEREKERKRKMKNKLQKNVERFSK